MSHLALYRTWRPQKFADMVGQKAIVQTLQNALREGRCTHAYLFSGPRGTGKTSTAKILAKALNCEHGPAPEPCNACHACEGIANGTVMDVVEIDAASNRGIDEAREIRDKVKYAPTEVRYKVYIIDEVHMLTTEAFNALLKTLEEPPAHVVFILATTEPHRLPATIVSRCQRFDFRRVSLPEQLERLSYICGQEGIDADREALELLAKLSGGGMRDALSLLDQVVSFSGKKVALEHVLALAGGLEDEQFVELAQALLARDVGRTLLLVDEWMQAGKHAETCMESLMQFFRDLLVVKLLPNADELTNRILDPRKFRELAEQFELERLFRISDLLNQHHAEMKRSPQPQMLYEIAMMKICALDGGGRQESAPAPNRAGGAELPAPPQDLRAFRELQRELNELKQRLEKLESEALRSAAGGAGSPGSSDMATFGGGQLASGIGAALAAAAHKSGNHHPAIPLRAFADEADADRLQHVVRHWNGVMQRIREEKVSLHAWLKDGTPTAVAGNALLLVFESEIHRETTEKPGNKKFIGQVVKEVLGTELELVTAMKSEWQAVHQAVRAEEAASAPVSSSGRAAEEPEELTMEAIDPQQVAEREDADRQKPWVKAAIEQFGEDLVVFHD